jgi:transcriptional regulator with XRE-family HTH domain
MGKRARRRPGRLAEKLLAIRDGLGLTQIELLEEFSLSGEIDRTDISEFERGVREPDMLTLKAYAEGAGLLVEDLIDDMFDLPSELPSTRRGEAAALLSPSAKPRGPLNRTRLRLVLKVQSDKSRLREENRARKSIEQSYLVKYGMKSLGDSLYELSFSHRDEASLDNQIYALLRAIKNEARANSCSVEITVREKDGDRYW